METTLKQVPDFPGYKLSRDGRVWSEKSGRFIHPVKRGSYLQVDLCKNNRIFPRLLHRIMLFTYVGPCPKGMECRHLNGNPLDNRIDNLKWGTRIENARDCNKHGHRCFGMKSPLAKLSDDEVKAIRESYIPGLVTLKELGDTYGMGISQIHRIVHKQAWTHLCR